MVSKSMVTIDNLNEDQFLLDVENKKINLAIPVVEVVDSLEVDDSAVTLSANKGRELKEYINRADNIFSSIADAFDEPIYETGFLPPIP